MPDLTRTDPTNTEVILKGNRNMLLNIDDVLPEMIAGESAINSPRAFSIPVLDLRGELRPASVEVKMGGLMTEITTQYSFRIAKWRELYGERLDHFDGSHSYFEVLQPIGNEAQLQPKRDEIEVVRTSYVLESGFGNLLKVCWVMIGQQGPSALLVAPSGKMLSRCPLPRRFLSHGIRLHSISRDIAEELLAIRTSRKGNAARA
ncbi:MAG: hypothetical protein JWS10_1059 [Cypionkella sp.]|uniref:hypothetical protein n=1 Tax=Cypionkella sp. TaxID=2811411 RepID=UPI0026313A09|nr:hypothetical protein [Cypionkella sp.]MDB5658444.1 hypothetical protein [Cypionkella sp.]